MEINIAKTLLAAAQNEMFNSRQGFLTKPHAG
jgi:hypothetical protein